jgi:hypothetical protein
VSATEQVVELLGSLGESDRRWILDHLPPAARARLADHVDESDAAHSGTSQEFEWSSLVAMLADVNVQALTRALEHEPAWLVSAVLNAAEWPWRHEVLRGLPPSLRAELASLDRLGSPLARPATEFVLRELAARARDWPRAPARRTGLRALLSRLRIRSAR